MRYVKARASSRPGFLHVRRLTLRPDKASLRRMAKKTSAVVRYHNLAGLMRDLRKALDNGDQEAYELAELTIECLDLVEDGEDIDGEDDVSSATDGDTAAVDSRQQALRLSGDGAPRGPAPRLQARGIAASALDRALDGLAGAERDEAVAELDKLRMHSVGAPRVKSPSAGRVR